MGPIGILCIQRTLNMGRDSGLYTGIGAALSDLIYCLLTGMGMSIVTDFIQQHQLWLQIVGSVILFIFGIYLVKRNPASHLIKPKDRKHGKAQDFLTGFLFTLSNPLIIFLIIPLFARFSFPLPEEQYWWQILLGYLFIVGGAVAWWAVITYLVNKVRKHFNIRSMWIINIIIGAIVLVLSIYGLITGIIKVAN
ncbi:MAG: LysE family transporter [Muribaculaceae bacterium]|nr:LysE family transporter [Muribaculaceae bacterium]